MQKDLSVQLVTSKIKCGRRYAHVAGSLPTSRVVSLLIRFMLVNIFRKLINHYTKSLYTVTFVQQLLFSLYSCGSNSLNGPWQRVWEPVGLQVGV